MSCFTCLTIAGSDSGGGAGIQADIKTISALGVFATSVIAAITAQNTLGVASIFGIPPQYVREQIKAVLDDIRTDSIKIGMLHSAEIISAVFDEIKFKNIPIILDPVMTAKGGSILLEPSAVIELTSNLKHVTLITPNIPEAEAITNVKIIDLSTMKEAATKIHNDFGCNNVLIKGGHLEGYSTLTDVLYDGIDFHEFSSPKVASKNTHGSGCTFSSAIAAFIAQGMTIVAAVKEAHKYVAGAIQRADELNIGRGHGPLNHFWHTSCRPLIRNPMPVTDYLWNNSLLLYETIQGHGFVQGILDGTLPKESFQFFLEQDRQFLNTFDERLSVIVSKAPSSLRKELSDILEAGSNEKEMITHLTSNYRKITDSFLNTQLAPNNQLYLSFLTTVTREQPYYIGLASVLACFLLYNKIGHYLRDNQAKDTYAQWIEYYCGNEFTSSVTKLRTFMDKVSVNLSPGERERMLEYFKTAMKMEFMFWEMSLKRQNWPL
jgi:hydroxymethylpyrimidine kinase/phosphomethylpyrimidine kinase